MSVARPAVDNEKKRSHEEVMKNRRSNVLVDRPDYSYERHGHDSFDRQVKAPRLSNYVCMIINTSLIILIFSSFAS